MHRISLFSYSYRENLLRDQENKLHLDIYPYIYHALRSLFAICLLAVLGLQFVSRLTGYVNCMVSAYIIDHRDFTEDCGCIHYIAQTFDDQGNNNQLQSTAPVLKLQDYVPAHSEPAPQALQRVTSVPAGMVPDQYRYKGITSIFHPPCMPAVYFLI